MVRVLLLQIDLKSCVSCNSILRELFKAYEQVRKQQHAEVFNQ